jgi:signal transduction histidine kinase/ActR/RegA family two-component response regulator
MNERLRTEIRHLSFVYSASLVDADGHLRATTEDHNADNADFRSRMAYTVPRESTNNALYIGQPFIGSRDGRVTFVLSRRINDMGGAFGGVVIARVSLDYLAGFYAGVDITPDTAIRLARLDGVVLAQYPRSDEAIADNFDVQPAYAALPANEQIYRASQTDGHDRIVALHKVEDYPIIVEVARPVASVLHPWVQAELASASRTLSLALLAAALLWVLRAALERHQRLEYERRRLERELETAQRAQALGLLAASVAHDFNNVLSAIVGYAELVQKSVVTGSRARTSIDRLLNATERARLLVRRVLTLNPNRSVNQQLMPVAPLIAEVLQQIRATLPPSVIVKASGLDMPATIRGDATEVYQVIMNLCSNAIHAMPDGGTLTLQLESLQVQEQRSLALGQLHPGPWLCMSIVDSGIGLAEAQLKSIFEPFYTTRQPGQGTGIGLTVVRNIIISMNCALDVQSQPGTGTRMSVYWPQVEPEAATSVLSPEVHFSGRGETVLIVDDDAELVNLAEELLASLGYEPVGFADARVALEAFRRDPTRFDVVLTDEHMQAMRGCHLAKLVHEIDPTVPVILMTGHHDDDIDRRAAQAGVATILDKPLRADALHAALVRQSSSLQVLSAS